MPRGIRPIGNITLRHLIISLYNIQAYCDAIRSALESMESTGKLSVRLPSVKGKRARAYRMKGKIIARADRNLVVPGFCHPAAPYRGGSPPALDRVRTRR